MLSELIRPLTGDPRDDVTLCSADRWELIRQPERGQVADRNRGDALYFRVRRSVFREGRMRRTYGGPPKADIVGTLRRTLRGPGNTWHSGLSPRF